MISLDNEIPTTEYTPCVIRVIYVFVLQVILLSIVINKPFQR